MAAVALSVSLAPVSAAEELLSNGGFEAGTSNWAANGGSLTQVSSPVKSGGQAAALTSNSAGAKWLYQDVGVSPGAGYAFSGYARKNNPTHAPVYLRPPLRGGR